MVLGRFGGCIASVFDAIIQSMLFQSLIVESMGLDSCQYSMVLLVVAVMMVMMVMFWWCFGNVLVIV